MNKKLDKGHPFPPRSADELWRLSDDCFFTRDKRSQYFKEMRSFYWRGAAPGSKDAEINRIYGEINDMVSLLYAPDEIILEGAIEGQTPDSERPILDMIVKTVRDNFFYRRLDIVSDMAIHSAVIDGMHVIRPLWLNGGVSWKSIAAEQIGVLYEALELRSENQIFCVEEDVTGDWIKRHYPDVWKDIENRAEADRASNMERARQGNIEIILGGQGSAQGVEVLKGSNLEYEPQSMRTTYRKREVWDFHAPPDDRTQGQWRQALLIEKVKVFDRLTGRSEHPYFPITPFPVENWIWGHSGIRLLGKIQTKRNDILEQIDSSTERLVDPPLLITGYQMGEEKGAEWNCALKEAGGFLIIDGNGVKAEPYIPKIAINDAYQQIEYRDRQTQYISGVAELMQGQAQKNVRSEGYANLLSAYGSRNLKRTAHIIEAQLEEIFTFTGKLYQENDATDYTITGRKDTAMLAQYAYDYRIEIYGHTGSPISNQENLKLTMMMVDKGMYPPDKFIDIAPVPFKDDAKKYILKQQMMKAAQAERQHEEEKKKQAASGKK